MSAGWCWMGLPLWGLRVDWIIGVERSCWGLGRHGRRVGNGMQLSVQQGPAIRPGRDHRRGPGRGVQPWARGAMMKPPLLQVKNHEDVDEMRRHG